MADKLYLYILGEGDNFFGESKNDEICEFLMGTNWNELSAIEIKEVKNKLEEIANLF